jgi:AcrR family transcriptional regulator
LSTSELPDAGSRTGSSGARGSVDEAGESAACGDGRRGRPRSAAADLAILDAAAGLFAEHGYAGLRVDEVAEQAEVAKTTVYRRYPGKADLVMAAIEHLAGAEPVVPDTGSLEGDLLASARNVRRLLTSSALGRAIPAAIAANAQHPELAAAHRALVARRREPVFGVVQRAIDNGELPAATDVAVLVDQVTGPIFYRVFVSGLSVDDDVLTLLVTQAIAGARAATAASTARTTATDASIGATTATRARS